MAFQGELITFSLPANEIVLKFLQMKSPDQMKSIDLGMKFISIGTKQLQCWDNDEWKARLEKEKDRNDKLISSLGSDLQKEKDKNRLLEQNHRKKLVEVSSQIKEQTHLYFQNELSSLREQLERRDAKISQLNEENRSSFRSVLDGT